MALPKIAYPTYTCELPSTGEIVKYRPFTVDDEKILLTASESKDYVEIMTATKQVIENCCDLKDIEALTTYDVDYLFLQLRIKSVSPVSELFFRNVNCEKNGGNPCDKAIKLTINLEDVKIQWFDTESEDFVDYSPQQKVGGGYDVKIGNGVGVIMKHPGFAEKKKFAELEKATDADLIKLCIVSVYDEETVYDEFTDAEMDEFYSNLSTINRNKLSNFMENIPEMRYESTFTCKECGYKESILFNSLEDFFD